MDWESVPVSIEAFKAANRRFATGVTIVTTRNGDVFHGFGVGRGRFGKTIDGLGHLAR